MNRISVMTVGTGKSILKALEVLKQHNVEGKKVIVLTLFATPESKLIGLPRTKVLVVWSI